MTVPLVEEETGASPPHWYEHLEAKNAQPWFVVEPEEGLAPADGGDAAARRGASGGAEGRGPADSYTDGNDRPVHHPRHSGLDDPGRPRQHLRHHAGQGVVVIRSGVPGVPPASRRPRAHGGRRSPPQLTTPLPQVRENRLFGLD
jgi:hypothetical protein